LKQQRIKDFLILEEEFIQNQERLKPREEKTEVGGNTALPYGCGVHIGCGLGRANKA
jgi:hypothetical protein